MFLLKKKDVINVTNHEIIQVPKKHHSASVESRQGQKASPHIRNGHNKLKKNSSIHHLLEYTSSYMHPINKLW